MLKHPFYRDCTEFCKSVEHGDQITSAITKRSISDLELCSYLNYLCANCGSVKDSFGRTALHVASSCGRLDLVKWLLNIKNANINLRDEESGYTALHRSLFYGKINVAVELIKLGANGTSYDMDSLTPLEHVTKDGLLPDAYFGTLYTWGVNNNNCLGSFNSRAIPECLDIFHKKYPKVCIQQVCIDKFHSVIVTTAGEVYSCGHGLGGRLCLGTEQATVVPTQIDFQSTEKVVISKASISRDHCLFLTYDQMSYSCGSNKHKVLGLSPAPDQVLVPHKIKQLLGKSIEGIRAARYHSCAWTSTILYTWGLNAGQLGHELGNGNNYIIIPKQVKVIHCGDSSIKQVASSDGAVAVTTAKGDIYVLHEYQCRKIASRLLDIADIAIVGGNLNSSLNKELKLANKELKVIVRTNIGNLLLWQESDPQLCRCIFSISRAIIVKQMFLNINEILFITEFGEAYKGIIKPRKKKPNVIERKDSFSNFLNKEECVTIKPVKIPRIHRAVAIVSDPRGEDYCVIQQNPYNRNLFQDDSPESEMKEHLTNLLREADEDDNIHDIRITVGSRVFPAHKYMLAQRSNILKGMRCDEDEIVLPNVNIDIFEQMLYFIYTGDCDLLQVGKCPEQFKKYCAEIGKEEKIEIGYESNLDTEKIKKKIQNPIRMLQEISKRYGCIELYKLLGSYDMQGSIISGKNVSTDNNKAWIFQRKSFPEYCDIILRCSDNQEIPAHKCILAARTDYFNSMFSVRWSNIEKITINIEYPSKLVEALVEFLYTDQPNFLSNKDCDFLLKLLVLADEYLVHQLKNHCACLLLTLTYLDLKNAVDILQFAHYYQANTLKQGVMKYIVSNMAYFLETQALNDLNNEILQDLTQTYFEQRPKICCRVITPYSTAISDEELIRISKIYSVNTEVPENKKSEKMPNKSSKRKLKLPKSSLTNNIKKCFEDKIENADAIIQFPDSMDISQIQEEDKENNIRKQKHLTAILSAIDALELDDDEPIFTNLNNTSITDFPLLNSPTDNNIHKYNSPPNSGRSWTKHDKHKLSQKDRKRLSSESKEPPQTIPESPKNPWKVIVPLDTTSPTASPSYHAVFTDILSNERKQKENLAKITNKLLVHTQLEDKAIVELEKFYNIENVEDEIITIQRVDIGNVAAPVWVPRGQSHSHS